MIETIVKCYVCGDYYSETSLEAVMVTDQTGYIKKPVCRSCLKKIEARSSRKETDGEAEKRGPIPLMEDEG
jgi:hypothetical protein